MTDDDDDDDDDSNDGDDHPDYTVTRMVSLYTKIIGHIIHARDLHRLITGHIIRTGTCLDRLYRHEFFYGSSGPEPTHYRAFTITLRHNILGRTPPYE